MNGPFDAHPMFAPQHGHGWALLLVLLAAVAFTVAAIVIVVVLLRLIRRGRLWRPSSFQTAEDPERILETRLARGEIDTEEFGVRMDALRQARERRGR